MPVFVPETVRSEFRTADGTGVRVRNPSVLVYDVAGRGFTRFHGVMGLENKTSEIGSTLNPQIRFFVFDTEPNMDSLVPPLPGAPLPPPPRCTRKRRRSTASSGTCSDVRRPTPSAELRTQRSASPSSGDRPSARGSGRSDLGVDDEAGVPVDLLSSESCSSVGWHRSSGDHEIKTKDLADVVGLVS